MSDDAKRRFAWLFLPVVGAAAVIGGYWFCAHSRTSVTGATQTDHPIGFLAANSVGEAMLQLDVCLSQYALVQGGDTFPEDLEPIGPDGIRCAGRLEPLKGAQRMRILSLPPRASEPLRKAPEKLAN